MPRKATPMTLAKFQELSEIQPEIQPEIEAEDENEVVEAETGIVSPPKKTSDTTSPIGSETMKTCTNAWAKISNDHISSSSDEKKKKKDEKKEEGKDEKNKEEKISKDREVNLLTDTICLIFQQNKKVQEEIFKKFPQETISREQVISSITEEELLEQVVTQMNNKGFITLLCTLLNVMPIPHGFGRVSITDASDNHDDYGALSDYRAKTMLSEMPNKSMETPNKSMETPKKSMETPKKSMEMPVESENMTQNTPKVKKDHAEFTKVVAKSIKTKSPSVPVPVPTIDSKEIKPLNQHLEKAQDKFIGQLLNEKLKIPELLATVYSNKNKNIPNTGILKEIIFSAHGSANVAGTYPNGNEIFKTHFLSSQGFQWALNEKLREMSNKKYPDDNDMQLFIKIYKSDGDFTLSVVKRIMY